MGVEVVDEQEEGHVLLVTGVGLQHGPHRRVHLGSRPRVTFPLVGEGVESLAEAVVATEVGDGGRPHRPVAGAGEHLRHRLRLRDQRHAVDVHAVSDGVKGGEQGGVARVGGGQGNHRVLEEHALGGQRIDERRRRTAVAVTPEVVGAQGVDRDEHDAGAAAASAEGERRQESDRNGGEQAEPPACRPLPRRHRAPF